MTTNEATPHEQAILTLLAPFNGKSATVTIDGKRNYVSVRGIANGPAPVGFQADEGGWVVMLDIFELDDEGYHLGVKTATRSLSRISAVESGTVLDRLYEPSDDEDED